MRRDKLEMQGSLGEICRHWPDWWFSRRPLKGGQEVQSDRRVSVGWKGGLVGLRGKQKSSDLRAAGGNRVTLDSMD